MCVLFYNTVEITPRNVSELWPLSKVSWKVRRFGRPEKALACIVAHARHEVKLIRENCESMMSYRGINFTFTGFSGVVSTVKD
jgi:hypothetical protein